MSARVRVTGTFGPNRDGHYFVKGFCERACQSIVINLSREKVDTTNPDYTRAFDRHCCKGRRRHVIE